MVSKNNTVNTKKITKLHILGHSLLHAFGLLFWAWGPGLFFGGVIFLVLITIATFIVTGELITESHFNEMFNNNPVCQYIAWYIFIISSSILPIEFFDKQLKRKANILRMVFETTVLHLIAIIISVLIILVNEYLIVNTFVGLSLLFYIHMFTLLYYFNNKSVIENNKFLKSDALNGL